MDVSYDEFFFEIWLGALRHWLKSHSIYSPNLITADITNICMNC